MAHDQFEYDVALSFASEDKAVAEEFANLLRAEEINVLLDEYHTYPAGANDIGNHIAELCRTKARYCLLLISQHYPLHKWTEAERSAAQEHALRDADEYIVPVRLDDVEVPGVTKAAGYQDLRQSSMKSIVALLEHKLEETKGQSGPPSKSHDLRSGNIPSTRRKSENQRKS